MTYSIKVTPNYYGGTCNAPQVSYLTWRDLADNPNRVDSPCPDDIAQWDTADEAQDVINNLIGDGPYYLSHGEASAPDYEIIEDLDDGNDDCQSASGIELNCFEEVNANDLPDGVQAELDSLDVEYHRSGDDYNIYTAEITHDNIRYMIAYCPYTVALQINADDLGGLYWDKQAYFKEIY